MAHLKFIDLFAGIGVIRLPFDELEYKNVFDSEFNEPACNTYEANLGHRPSGDITKISAAEIPSPDLLLTEFLSGIQHHGAW